MLLPEIKLVVFDWAGTTIDFGCLAPAGAFIAAFQQRGITVTQAEARAPMGLHKKEHMRVMLREPDLAQRWRAHIGRDWTEADIDDLYRVVTPMQVEAARIHSQVVPDLLDCVATLRSRGIKIAGTTGYFREAADACIEAARVQGYVPDFTIGADEVPAGRPAPWMFFRCMEATGVYPASAVVKVGDTAVDMAEARNAGAWAVGVIDSSSEMGLSREEFLALPDAERDQRREAIRQKFLAAGGHTTIRNLSELPELIRTGERPASTR